MSRLRLFFLAVFLLLGQWGGLAHGISHAEHEKGQPHGACQLCAAYSALDHGLAGKAPPPAIATPAITPFLYILAGRLSPPALPYRSRAPPGALS